MVATVSPALFVSSSLMAVKLMGPVLSRTGALSAALALIAAAAWERLCRLRPDRPAFGRRLRQAGTALVCLWVTTAVIEQGVMWCVAAPGEKLFRDLETLLPDPPKDARIYIVNLCPLNAVALDQAVKVRYGRADISACGLTLAPTLESTSMDRITRTGLDTIRIDRENGVYFKSFIERFHLFSDPVSQLPASARRLDLELINPPRSFDGLTALEFRLPYAVDDPRVSIFVWNNERIKSPIDLISVTRLAELERFDAQVAFPTTATE